MATRILTPDETVAMLRKYVDEGGHDAKMIAGLVRDVIEGEMWRQFASTATGELRSFTSFQQFVTERKGGLGVSKTALIAWISAADPEAAELVERAWKGEVQPLRKHGGARPEGQGRATTMKHRDEADGILARLKRDDPETAEKVVNGDLSANAAALAKGWRKPRVLLTTPSSVAAAIRKHRDSDWIANLVKELS